MMQLIENSPFGLRSAWHQLKAADANVTVTLYPIIHLGEPAFFEAVYRDAMKHDVVLIEGVGGAVGRRLTRSYRWIAGRRLGLIVQSGRALLDGGRARVVHADLTAEEFQREWQKVPLGIRLYVAVAVPIVGLLGRWFATRESIGERLEMDDLKSREEILRWDPQMAALSRGILESRDVRLVERLAAELDCPRPAPSSLAVLFGAAHMRAVLAELKRRGFRSVDSRWETVFSYD